MIGCRGPDADRTWVLLAETRRDVAGVLARMRTVDISAAWWLCGRREAGSTPVWHVMARTRMITLFDLSAALAHTPGNSATRVKPAGFPLARRRFTPRHPLGYLQTTGVGFARHLGVPGSSTNLDGDWLRPDDESISGSRTSRDQILGCLLRDRTTQPFVCQDFN